MQWGPDRVTLLLEGFHCTGLAEFGKTHLFGARRRDGGTELVQLEDSLRSRTLTFIGCFALEGGLTPLPDVKDDWVLLEAGPGWEGDWVLIEDEPRCAIEF